MKYAIALIIGFITLFTSSAQAESLCDSEVTFGVHLGTYHTRRDLGFQEVNPGAYVRFCGGVTAGVYRNSYNVSSAYIGYTASYGPVDFTVGAISGYQNRVMPLVIPSVKLPFGGFRLAFVPPIPNLKRNSAALHLMVEF